MLLLFADVTEKVPLISFPIPLIWCLFCNLSNKYLMKEFIIPFVFCISAKCDKMDFILLKLFGVN